MIATHYRLASVILLNLLFAGCSLTIGGRDQRDAVPSFSIQGVGQGNSEAEANKDARRNATEELHAQGYSGFRLEDGSGRSMTSSGNGYEVRNDFAVKDAVRDGRNEHCPCGRGRKSNCNCQRD